MLRSGMQIARIVLPLFMAVAACAADSRTPDASTASSGAAVSGTAVSGDARGGAGSSVPPALLQRLKRGGYVIYFRHAATDHDVQDVDRDNLENCATQRNLSERGRRQARDIAAAFERLSIPVGKVLSSPYCRCVDTVKALGAVQKSSDLVFALGTGRTATATRAEALRGFLSAKPPVGANTVLGGHTVNLREAAGIWPKPEGVAVVFEPLGDGFRYIAAVHPDAWRHTSNTAGVVDAAGNAVQGRDR